MVGSPATQRCVRYASKFGSVVSPTRSWTCHPIPMMFGEHCEMFICARPSITILVIHRGSMAAEDRVRLPWVCDRSSLPSHMRKRSGSRHGMGKDPIGKGTWATVAVCRWTIGGRAAAGGPFSLSSSWCGNSSSNWVEMQKVLSCSLFGCLRRPYGSTQGMGGQGHRRDSRKRRITEKRALEANDRGIRAQVAQ